MGDNKKYKYRKIGTLAFVVDGNVIEAGEVTEWLTDGLIDEFVVI